ncbi:MAG: hypothetical protein DI537_41420 [Stutzerimonas stutzeri]|nr:MAG: hypothetical protein DI537_41420 [Stutzerimonas stutzeri]
MARAAEALALESARAYQRYETGENRPDAPLTERIFRATAGQVTPTDLHEQRLAWLRAHRPEVLDDEHTLGAQGDAA